MGDNGHEQTHLAALSSLVYLDHIAVTVTAALQAHGFRALLLKGRSFTELFFDAGETRWYSDVDLLVSPDAFPAAAAVLEEQGFHDRFRGAAASETSPYATEFGSDRAIVDLHRSLPGVTVDDTTAWRVLSRSTAQVAMPEGEVEALSPAGRAVHAALHAATNGVGNARSVEDVRRAAARLSLELWRDGAAIAEEIGALPSLAAGLCLVPEGRARWEQLGLDVDIPRAVALRATTPPPLTMGFDRLASTPGLRSKVAFLARRVVPTPSGLRYWSPLARRGRLGLAAAYLWRPLYLVIRAPAAARARQRARRR